MQFKPFYWLGALALMALVLYSCQKDEITDNLPTTTTNPTTPDIPTNNSPVLVSEGHTIENETSSPDIIGLQEIKGSMKAKALVKDIIQETFMQLVLSHEFNPFMPLSERETCGCTGLAEDGLDLCGCPFQEDVTPAGAPSESTTIRLSYKNPTTCLACTPASTSLPSGGFTIFGEVDITVVGNLGSVGHSITIAPNDNFTVDGHDFDATSIALQSIYPPGPETIAYMFTSLSGVAVTDPDGNTTTLIDGGNFPLLTIEDIGENHGDITVGFGLLDDVYTLILDDAEIQCSNGHHVFESTTSDDMGENPLVFDMTCECIEGGVIVMHQAELDANGDYVPVETPDIDGDGELERVTLSIVDYGYTETAGVDCDDKIEISSIKKECLSLTGGPNVATVRTPCYDMTVVDCL